MPWPSRTRGVPRCRLAGCSLVVKRKSLRAIPAVLGYADGSGLRDELERPGKGGDVGAGLDGRDRRGLGVGVGIGNLSAIVEETGAEIGLGPLYELSVGESRFLTTTPSPRVRIDIVGQAPLAHCGTNLNGRTHVVPTGSPLVLCVTFPVTSKVPLSRPSAGLSAWAAATAEEQSRPTAVTVTARCRRDIGFLLWRVGCHEFACPQVCGSGLHPD